MKISQLAINSVSTRHANLEEALDAYAEAGFKNIEFQLGHVKEYLANENSPLDVRALLDARGQRCIGGFEGMVEAFSAPEQRAKNHAATVANARLLSELGGTNLVVGVDGPADLSKATDPIGTLAAALAEIGGQIAPFGVNVLVEFNWSPLVKSFRTAAEIARRSGAANVGVLFDPAHYHCTPTKFEQITAENTATVRHVHVDNMRDKPGELSNCNNDRVLPGDPAGCLDLGALFGALEGHGYDGFFSIEMFSEELWALPAKEAARRMYQSLLPLCRE